MEEFENIVKVAEEVRSLNIFDSKYIVNPRVHIDICDKLLKLLNPKGKILDVGCGNGYLLYLCRELYGCEVTGLDRCDRDDARTKIYTELTKRLNINVIKHTIKPLEAMPIFEKYDLITATMTMFNNNWSVNQHKFWINDCQSHLVNGGKIILLTNKETLTPASKNFLEPFLLSHRTYIIPDRLCPIQKDHQDLDDPLNPHQSPTQAP